MTSPNPRHMALEKPTWLEKCTSANSNGSTKPLFQYEPLRNHHDFRVIALLPAPSRDSPIVISLSVANAGEQLPIAYEALSYTWDNQTPTREITCNGMTLHITANVYMALQQLRLPQPEIRMLWIDSICIDQQSIEDKTLQVSMMGNIYIIASEVIIWLTRPTKPMMRAFDLVRLLAKESASGFGSKTILPMLNDGVKQLAGHAYWTRAWTVQEVAMNKNSWVYLGRQEPMRFSDFAEELASAEDHLYGWSERTAKHDKEELYTSRLHMVHSAGSLKFHSPESHGSPLDWEFLAHLIAKKATNPRDIIFAFRGLLPVSLGAMRGAMRVDYNRDVRKLLIEATTRLIPHISKIGDLFDLVSLSPPVSGAPSWTLNLACGKYFYRSKHYWWAFETSPESRNTATVSADYSTLSVEGLVFDHVAMVSEQFPQFTFEDRVEWHVQARRIMRGWRHHVLLQSPQCAAVDDAIIDILYAHDGTKRVSPTSGRLDELPEEKAQVRKLRMPPFLQWMEVDDFDYRLDREEMLRTTHAEYYKSKLIRRPAYSDRCLFMTDRGRMGLCRNIYVGDKIALMSSCDLPYSLRHVPERNGYLLGQPVVMPGVMIGELWPTEGDSRLEKIHLV